jgi:processive 1,2-diacylglycerol beta-glucosyltransferase
MTRILCFYLTIGSGHRTAAEAAAQAVPQIAPQAEAVCLDPIHRAWPGLIALLNGMHALTTLLARGVYDREWRAGRVRPALSWLAGQPGVRALFENCLDEYQPEAVICTHAFPALILAALKRTRPRLTLVGVPTDFGLHALWPLDGVDHYCVPGPQARGDLEARGFDPHRITETGIPIDSRCAEAGAMPGPEPGARRVLVVAGARRLGPYVSALPQILGFVDRLGQLAEGAQVVIVAGSNRWLRRELERRAAHLPVPVRIIGYTHDMPSLIRSAELVVSKPGGLITAEALAAGTPFVIVAPGPGQERANAEYLLEHGAGVLARDADEILRVVGGLLRDPARRAGMAERARGLGKPRAALRVAQTALALLNHRREAALGGAGP